MKITETKTKTIIMTRSSIPYGHGVIIDLTEKFKQNLLVAQRMLRAVEEVPKPGFIHFDGDAIMIDLNEHQEGNSSEFDAKDDERQFSYLQDEDD